jgi:cation transport ATPase
MTMFKSGLASRFRSLYCHLHIAWSSKRAPLLKDRLALERTRDLDIVSFDKTGTLTPGSPAIESGAEHPLAKAIVSETLPPGD